MSSPTESSVTFVVEKNNENTDDDDFDVADEYDDNDDDEANTNANYNWAVETESSIMDPKESNVDEDMKMKRMVESKGMYRNPLYRTLESRVR